MQVLVDVDRQLAAVELARHRRVAAAQHVGDRGAAGAGARGASSPPRRARRSARGCGRARQRAVQNDTLVRLGNSAWCSMPRADARRGPAPRARRASGTRIAHCGLPIVTCWKPTSARRPAARRAVGRPREVLGLQPRAAHVDAARALVEDRRADLAGGRLDRELAPRRSSRARRRYRIASRAPLPDSSASEPSGLKIRSRATKPRRRRRRRQLEDAVGADAVVAVAQRAHARRRQRERQPSRSTMM